MTIESKHKSPKVKRLLRELLALIEEAEQVAKTIKDAINARWDTEELRAGEELGAMGVGAMGTVQLTHIHYSFYLAI